MKLAELGLKTKPDTAILSRPQLTSHQVETNERNQVTNDWVQGKITDDEYIKRIQAMIDSGAISHFSGDYKVENASAVPQNIQLSLAKRFLGFKHGEITDRDFENAVLYSFFRLGLLHNRE